MLTAALIVLGVTVAITAAAIAASLAYSVVFPRHHDVAAPDPHTQAADRDMALRLEGHVRAVASRPHNLAYPDALDETAREIETRLIALAAHPTRHTFAVDGRDVANIEVVVEADADSRAERETIVIGAHYDSPDDSPGAHDNGTGVAALIELARLMRERAPGARRVRLVFFVNEEAPYGKTDAMGSLVHARRLRADGERVVGMIALETIGYFSTRPGSQNFPFPFDHVYRDRGDFVAFVGLVGARTFTRSALAAFRATGAFPSIGGVAPGFIAGIDMSDHWAYDQCGFPALMVTDTAPFRNPFYHQTCDTPDTVDYMSLARIVRGLDGMVATLAGQPTRDRPGSASAMPVRFGIRHG
ncbi:MAG: M28 family peptidase [Hyphomicrobiaceae bacterium]|nr:M28 family peptidase [Hyphomicrobiaceae bacterium]